ncbi:LuxR C-terminal-related transcriptional regulator [Streptomyces sp. NPDC059221]|uniref:LuxR C-terminal-related transcriptional regulator n=2 Tax=unclassified Streptomyces TaxID=2593676 RepID=UPI0036C7C63D
MLRMSNVELRAAVRRGHRAGMKMRGLERSYNVSRQTVKKAKDSVWPEPREKLPPRPAALDPYSRSSTRCCGERTSTHRANRVMGSCRSCVGSSRSTAAARAAAEGSPGEAEPREREMPGLVAQGCANSPIAAGLFISDAAVNDHSGNVFSKLALPLAVEGHRRGCQRFSPPSRPDRAPSAPGCPRPRGQQNSRDTYSAARRLAGSEPGGRPGRIHPVNRL